MTFPIKDRSDPLPILVGWPHDGQSKGRTCYSGLFEWKGLLSSRKSFLRGMGSMEKHEKPYNRSFARGTFSYFKNQWILHPDFRNCTFKNHTTGLCPRKCNSSVGSTDTFPSRARSRPAYGPFSPSGKARLAALGKCAVYHSSDHLPIHFLYIL